MFEKDLPGHNTAGFSADTEIGVLPLETAETMAHRWGFSLQDKSYKSSYDLIQYLVKAAGYNSNFLLNVGPMPNGKIQQEFIDTLKIVGQWTERYGETIYGTRGGPIPPQTWGVTTKKGDKIFVHVLNWTGNYLLLPSLKQKFTSIYSFDAKTPLEYLQTEYGTLVELPPKKASDPDVILEITVKN